MSTAAGGRSRKDLASTGAATAYQREFVKTLQKRVIEDREPFAIAQADTALEIFHVMDIPVISNQWWSAYISAKQLSGRYLRVLSDRGYPDNSCRYCTLGLGCTLDGDAKTAPWGGLPRPTVITARLTCDCIQRVFTHWADAMGTRFYPFEAPGWTHKEPRWFDKSNTEFREVFEPHRIALHVEEMKGLIRWLEGETGRTFDDGKLLVLMEKINEQESLMFEAAKLIGATRPCPVAIADQIPNVMIPQWHRGSDWALAHARRFRDEVAQRVADGVAVSPNERLRLMWIGAGLWHDPSFYSEIEARYGAVFVWSMYLPFSGPQYVRRDLSDPMSALASRICSLNEVLHLPPWMNEWMVSEAKRSGIDAAIILTPATSLLSSSGTKITAHALEAAGVPALALDADMVDGASWEQGTMLERVSRFLEERVVSGR